jgi:hypothetical protein
LTLRFPDGDVEHRSTNGELPVGTLIRTRGTRWRVREVLGFVVMLEHAEASADSAVDGAPTPSGPTAIPAADDEPLIVEVVSAA